MSKLLLLLLALCLSCGPSDRELSQKLRDTPSCIELLEEIEMREDVVTAILSDGLGICVAMSFSHNNPEAIARYIIKEAARKGLQIKFCKIVSSYDYSWGEWYMTGTQLAFESNFDYK